MDALSILLVIVGAVIVYGVKPILKALNINLGDYSIIIIKLVGLIIAIIGFLRIFEII